MEETPLDPIGTASFRRDERSKLADLHRRVLAGEPGAVEGVRAYLHARTWTADGPAELRFLLRVLADAGLLDLVGASDLLAAVLRSLGARPAPSGGPRRDDDAATLSRLSSLIEAGVDPPTRRHRAGQREPPPLPEPPESRVVRRTLKDICDGKGRGAILRAVLHEVALAHGAAAPEGARAAEQRRVYVGVLERTATRLLERDARRAGEAARLLDWLGAIGMVRMVSNTDSASCERRITLALSCEGEARLSALEEALLTEPCIEEVFATSVHLAWALAEWG